MHSLAKTLQPQSNVPQGLDQQKAIKTGRTEHQDAKMTSMRPRVKEVNDNP